MDSILAGLNDDDESILKRAIASAGDSQDDEVVSRLRDIVKDDDKPDGRREEAAAALGRCGNERAAALLVELAHDGNPKLREYGVLGLGGVESRESLNALLAALSDRVNTVRNVAERSLLGMTDLVRRHGMETLLELLDHPAPLTRSPAARLLGQSGDDRALDPLVAMLQSDEEWLGRTWAASALGDLGSGGAFDALADRLANDEKNRVRAAAAEALGRIRHERSEAVLKSALEDDDEGVQKAVREALQSLGTAGFED